MPISIQQQTTTQSTTPQPKENTMAKTLFHSRFFLVTTLLLLYCGSHLPVVESLSSSSSASSSTSTSSISTSSFSTTPSPVGVVTSLNRIELGLKKFPRSWVPIASTFELDPNRPTPLQFLGQSYVTYQDNTKQWIVLDDRCPHRLAPLSEGRIDRDTDSLECSYHGWAFSSQGACLRIPQVTEAVAETVMANPKSCVASYPTHVEQGILWMWPWPEDVLSVQADGTIAATPESLMAYTSGRAGTATSSYTRDLPYGWDTLVENLIDPSHVPFAHHGLQGKRTDAIAINMTVPISKKGAAGFSFEFGDRTVGMVRQGNGEFRAPFTIVYDATFQSDPPRPFKLSTFCIPTKAGWSRAIVQTLSGTASAVDEEEEEKDKADVTTTKKETKATKKKPKKSLVAVIFNNLPPWVVHQLTNVFFDSDLAFLHFQERERQRSSSNNAYFIPAPADRCIAALQQWLKKHVDLQNDTAFAPLPPSPSSRLELFNRYSQHTSHCKICQDGLKSLQKWRRRTYATLAMSLLIGLRYLLARVVVVLCLAILPVMQTLESSFRQGDYKHYEKK